MICRMCGLQKGLRYRRRVHSPLGPSAILRMQAEEGKARCLSPRPCGSRSDPMMLLNHCRCVKSGVRLCGPTYLISKRKVNWLFDPSDLTSLPSALETKLTDMSMTELWLLLYAVGWRWWKSGPLSGDEMAGCIRQFIMARVDAQGCFMFQPLRCLNHEHINISEC